ncbi:hypothetical protein A3A09_02400 [Candidatus Nomurabacteria bacterium RIFCSPLOWO2_01_FULL_42_20]|uniref:Penicillin-binding protein transpeptidase domain-containing protein n=1 Tax=Candidatus Nomurabacteria bacterium RIFCSPHIGHO2_01_FULL_42_16 TaxID=1801743 RepID=A0A1F6VK69_9BACT|nr:MAG: hypothetical protein A2824_01415 [Candidatus Nomurabacteria bacterium RIFCSPHIGHO2_01_FULL_42_16]OGI92130.1 MAG: hypothetical protein A3A09_02400 [Candidatus Nomurabacteria bacterium RIFCSPLOWO2_01_FULL_42_20]
MKSNLPIRIRAISIIIFASYLFLIGKLFLVQIVHGSQYDARADRQYVTPSEKVFERGSIFFKKKDGSKVSAAMTIAGFKLAISPKDIVLPESVYEKLSDIVFINKEDFLARAGKKDDPYEEIAWRLSKEEADKVSALKLNGVFAVREKWRFYPGNEMAAQTIGFVAYKEDDFSGRYGLERFYNDVLSYEGTDLYVNFFAEVFGTLKDTIFKNPKKEGDLITTIEPVVQGFLEKTLQGVAENWQAEQAGAIIIDPLSGAIYALSSYPTFDLNNFSKVKEVSTFSNPLVENVFEFGSIIKPLTVSAGLDVGAIVPETTYNDRGYVVVGDKKIENFDKKARGVVPIQEILSQSLNTGSVMIMQKLGRERFRDYMFAFSLDERTGIDLPSEAKSLTSNLKSPRDLEYATASFGQGVAISPIEAVQAFSVVANGGYLISPHIVYQIDYKEGGKKEFVYGPGKQVIKKETSEEITRMLTFAVDKAFGGGKFKMEHYSVAAKTGTAQIANLEDGGYYEDKHLHSFFGYFPSYNPKFLALFYLKNPRRGEFAVQTLMPSFMDTAKFLLNYYEVPPDR